ncbi:MAG: TraB/GumN family protein [Bacteroidota bacterium]
MFKILFVLYALATKPLLANTDSLPVSNTMLWEISGNGLSSKSYLFGTIHSICLPSLRIAKTVKEKLLASDEAVFEINTIKYDTLAAKANFMPGSTLKELIGSRYFEKVKKIISRYKPISDDSLNRLKPFIVSIYIANAALQCRITSYDAVLLQIARSEKIPVSNIESIDEHNRAVNELPLKRQAELLKGRVDNLNLIVQSMTEDISMYLNNNLMQLYQKSTHSDSEDEVAFKTALLDTRSRQWLSVIEEKIKRHACFFAFGCSHLPGNAGIINLLRAKGYIVTPVYYPI